MGYLFLNCLKSYTKPSCTTVLTRMREIDYVKCYVYRYFQLGFGSKNISNYFVELKKQYEKIYCYIVVVDKMMAASSLGRMFKFKDV